MESINRVPNFQDRIDIFSQLTTDEVSQKLDDEKFEALLGDHYQDFAQFCTFLIPVADRIGSVSCWITDNEIHFETTPI